MLKFILSYITYYWPVINRRFVYWSLAFFTTFLDKTADLKNFTDFNLWMWFRTALFCYVACLLIERAFMDNTVQKHKLDKVKSGDTTHISKSEVESIKSQFILG